MNIPIDRTELIAIEYPGTVNNISKLDEHFGGAAKLDATLRNPSKRLELFLRPKDPFSKSCHGDKFNTTAFMLEIIRKKHKKTGEVTYELKYHGFFTSIYKFKSMCDFQLLPLVYDKEKQKMESLLPKLLPDDLHLSDWFEQDVPLFAVPLMFSRFDIPQTGYVEKHKPKVPVKSSAPFSDPKLISRNRPKRNTYTIFKTFESRDTCMAPMKEALKTLLQHPSEVLIKEKLDVLFSERPVWTKNAIVSIVNCDKPRLKYALTSSAYYFSNGPWRTLWVKFGYDPRKDPNSKIYQIMDFRISANIKIDESSLSKTRCTEFHIVPSKSASQKTNSRIPMINATHFAQQEDLEENTSQEPDEEPSHLLIPGRMPPTRQCYFQLCDILYDDVQKLVHRNDGKEQFCHEKDGWCDIGVLDKCREIILRDIKETAQRQEQEK